MMLSPLEIGAGLTAGFGGAAMMWGNIKGVFARFESLFIVKAELFANMGESFLEYASIEFKSSPFGVKKFYCGDYFIRPKNRVGRVASEAVGKFNTFWNGWRPIFVSNDSEKNNSNNNSSASISFIRGTFNLEKLLIDATNFHDKKLHEKTNKNGRYYVRRCFGKKNANPKNGVSAQSLAQDGVEPPTSRDGFVVGFRPLFYSRDDIGTPISKKPMANLVYEDSVQEFYGEVERWKESKEWFKDKGLPWRFGAGIFGPPGTGKTSLARAIGQSLDMPIHSYDLTTMDNEELTNYWQQSLGESPCIVLLEDIDRIFDEKKQVKTSRDKSPLTLDCLLNCISGVQPSDGILTLVTANDVTKLDPALGVPDPTGKSTRPGRLDRAVYVGVLNKNGREKIAKRILSDCLDLIEDTVSKGEGETGAQFENRCSKLALEHYWGKFKVYGEDKISFSQITNALVPGTDKSADELRREDSYV